MWAFVRGEGASGPIDPPGHAWYVTPQRRRSDSWGEVAILTSKDVVGWLDDGYSAWKQRASPEDDITRPECAKLTRSLPGGARSSNEELSANDSEEWTRCPPEEQGPWTWRIRRVEGEPRHGSWGMAKALIGQPGCTHAQGHRPRTDASLFWSW